MVVALGEEPTAANEPTGGKTVRKREREKAPDLPTPPPAKVKTTIGLSWEAHERLKLHSLKLRRSHEELVEELINLHLRRFCIQDRGGNGDVAA